MDSDQLNRLVYQVLRKLRCRTNGFHQGNPFVIYRHGLGKLAPALHRLIQTAGQIGILLVVALFGKGVFLFIQKPLGVILIEASSLLGNAVEPQIQAGNEGILLIADVFSPSLPLSLSNSLS